MILLGMVSVKCQSPADELKAFSMLLICSMFFYVHFFYASISFAIDRNLTFSRKNELSVTNSSCLRRRSSQFCTPTVCFIYLGKLNLLIISLPRPKSVKQTVDLMSPAVIYRCLDCKKFSVTIQDQTNFYFLNLYLRLSLCPLISVTFLQYIKKAIK